MASEVKLLTARRRALGRLYDPFHEENSGAVLRL
jgi:hypothetical protein